MRAEKFVQTVEHLRRTQILGCGERAREIDPEIAQHLFPIDVVVRHLVELFLEAGGKVVADVTGEEAFEKSSDDAALVFRIEPFVLEPHIIPVPEYGERRSIGGGPADAEFLHPFDQGRLGEARRRLGEMLRRFDLFLAQGVAHLHRRQPAAVFVLLVVLAFLIELEEAVETDDLAAGAQVDFSRAGVRDDVCGRAFEVGRFHLAGDAARPDELIEAGFVTAEETLHIGRSQAHVGRADRFMRFLRVLCLHDIFARRLRNVAIAEIAGQ